MPPRSPESRVNEIETTLKLPLRIVVTGDTHFRRSGVQLPHRLRDTLSTADLIIHTGDFCSHESLRMFESFGPFLAVRGNNEEPDLDLLLPDRIRASYTQGTLIVTHGHREIGRSAKDAVQRTYAGGADIVIFGHSHQPCWEEVDGSWFLNPGSPTQRRREPCFSFAILQIAADGAFEAEHVYFEKRN
jgi:uncharacterized protein